MGCRSHQSDTTAFRWQGVLVFGLRFTVRVRIGLHLVMAGQRAVQLSLKQNWAVTGISFDREGRSPASIPLWICRRLSD
eukprot:m.784077 g.784077  ORF g.784077 m.784077 type:complete len:79 (-) comp59155_c0_seq24:1882-2118(-)